MKRIIKKVAILGSGVMGSRIACHFANIGLEVLLLDIVPRELDTTEQAKGLTLKDKIVRNRIVNNSLQSTLKNNPSPIYSKSYASRITTGNFEDDISKIKACDWIIEVVVENLKIKKIVFEQVEQHRTPGTLITSNTSGIPIEMMTEGRSQDFQEHFCGTHFFNPPRYLRLLEVIPSSKTKPAVIDFLMHYGDLNLGKTTVLCKDTPAFIANRIGVYSIMSLFHLVEKMGLTVGEVDKLTGTVMGRPKSATFRTCDVVGLDTLVHVANGVRDNCPNDEASESFIIPDYINKMVENNWLGSKTNQGFYKKSKNAEGEKEILELNLSSLEYETKSKVQFATLAAAKAIDDPKLRIKALVASKDKAGEFYRASFFNLFKYVSNRIPEIADEIYKVDDAMRAGFGWEQGPFELWDIIGLQDSLAIMQKSGIVPADWITKMLEAGNTSFYKIEDGVRKYYDPNSATYKTIDGKEDLILLDNLRDTKTVWSNSGAHLIDIGDGILNLEFHTKMNTIGSEVLEAINKSIDIAEKGYKGLVIANEGTNFSAGANLGMVFMLAIEQEYDEIDFAIKLFQNTMMRVRYSGIPVIAAPRGLTLGGGTELCLHADRVVAAAETYAGLVEVGVGVIPGGGGTKEFAAKVSESFFEGGIQLPQLKEKYLTIGMAKISTSAQEAIDLGYFKEGRDKIVLNLDRQIAAAKTACLEIANAGYNQPAKKKITVLGKAGLGMFYAGAHNMASAHYISEHDKLISQKLGYVICGGDLSQPTEVSEQYLLDLEREAFLQLLTEKKTLQRIESILKTGKPLRN
jgi:3-hydroxyacyl-CoA dehydrogenase